MKGVYLLDDAIISPLGFSTEENLQAIRTGTTGLKFHSNKRFPAGGFYAGILDPQLLKTKFQKLGSPEDYTKLEQMMLLAVQDIIDRNPAIDLTSTALVISTTKGNIDLLSTNKFSEERILLHGLADVIWNFFGFPIKPIIVSNACMSGGLALAVAKRFIMAGKFKQAIVVGGDLVSEFVISGFQSFQALSDNPCRPFSKNRNGISLGEAAAAVLVSAVPGGKQEEIMVTGESSMNDANHISGPSRTGEGLFKSIKLALKEANVAGDEVQYLSAHGTATLFNDEMESIAFKRAGLQEVPVNSYKGWYGHTLGASALLEILLTKQAMLNNELYPSLHFDFLGTSEHVNVIENYEKKELNSALKTASGFGGCNIALVLQKERKDG